MKIKSTNRKHGGINVSNVFYPRYNDIVCLKIVDDIKHCGIIVGVTVDGYDVMTQNGIVSHHPKNMTRNDTNLSFCLSDPFSDMDRYMLLRDINVELYVVKTAKNRTRYLIQKNGFYDVYDDNHSYLHTVNVADAEDLEDEIGMILGLEGDLFSSWVRVFKETSFWEGEMQQL